MKFVSRYLYVRARVTLLQTSSHYKKWFPPQTTKTDMLQSSACSAIHIHIFIYNGCTQYRSSACVHPFWYNYYVSLVEESFWPYELTLQASSPWKPPATRKLSLTASVLIWVCVKPSNKLPACFYMPDQHNFILGEAQRKQKQKKNGDPSFVKEREMESLTCFI